MPRKTVCGTRREQRIIAGQKAAQKELDQAIAERDYWRAWAELIGLGWTLYGWTRTDFAQFFTADRRVVFVNSDWVRCMEILAGSRAPKKP